VERSLQGEVLSCLNGLLPWDRHVAFSGGEGELAAQRSTAQRCATTKDLGGFHTTKKVWLDERTQQALSDHMVG
jgi:hypothetical protein